MDGGLGADFDWGARKLEIIESILAKANGLLWRCHNDADYTMEFVSDGVLRTLGYPASDFIGNKVRSFPSLTHAEDMPRLHAVTEEGIANRRGWNIDYRMTRADGRQIWVNEIGGPIFNDAGELEHLEGLIMEITPRKEIELKGVEASRDVVVKSGRMIDQTGAIFKVLGRLKLLSLNARIEAARVGAAGAGFAVVAQEMNALTSETEEVAQAIAAQIQDLRALMGK